MEIGTLKGIFLYPIKSTSGVSVSFVETEKRGLKRDREFAIYNSEGKIASGKNTRRFFRLDRIIDLQVECGDLKTSLVSSDGRKYSVPSSELNCYLSELLNTNLQVKRESEVPHMDEGHVHLVTTEDLKQLSAKYGKSVSLQRFRPNLLIESQRLSSEIIKGELLKIGSLAFKPTKSTERCRMITMPQGELGSEPKLLKTIADSGKVDFGIYLQPIEFGELEVGCQVTLK